LLTLATGEGTQQSVSRCHARGITAIYRLEIFPVYFSPVLFNVASMSRFPVSPLADRPLAGHSGVGVIEVSGRPHRYVVGSWLADKLMAVLWIYLVLRGVGWRRRSTPK
jgi:hypothetical protein